MLTSSGVRRAVALREHFVAARPVLTGVVLFLCEAARACPACVDPRDTTRAAMLTGTIALSLLPLGFIGGVAAWLWHAHKNGDDGEQR
jgi:hypothetical protein